jgi:ubiquinone/menaquinone biosynthesis C-methylase UbiE
VNAATPSSSVLEIGGGDRRYGRANYVNLEFTRFELADVHADGHGLPFADSSFDMVVSQAVFEHIRQPFDAAAEALRVTKPGGLVVTEVAFLQPVHAVPHHYFNMTVAGVRELFPGCEEVESGWFGSLATTVDWMLDVSGVKAADAQRSAEVVSALRKLDRKVSYEKLESIASGVFLVVRKPLA